MRIALIKGLIPLQVLLKKKQKTAIHQLVSSLPISCGNVCVCVCEHMCAQVMWEPETNLGVSPLSMPTLFQGIIIINNNNR